MLWGFRVRGWNVGFTAYFGEELIIDEYIFRYAVGWWSMTCVILCWNLVAGLLSWDLVIFPTSKLADTYQDRVY